VQVYTGDGKGKTTAAVGLAVRAAGRGLRVYIGQFLKATLCGEHDGLAGLADRITIERFGRKGFICGPPTPEDVAAARAGLARAREVLAGGDYDLVILDEANVATLFGVFGVQELLAAVEARSPGVEVVITGRGADARLIQRADLVTEMRCVKHYYDGGQPARRGIED